MSRRVPAGQVRQVGEVGEPQPAAVEILAGQMQETQEKPGKHWSSRQSSRGHCSWLVVYRVRLLHLQSVSGTPGLQQAEERPRHCSRGSRETIGQLPSLEGRGWLEAP